MKTRCKWCGNDPVYISYHDNEWGVPLHDDQRLFEMLVLEGAQAGLSWLTILKKRENYRRAFDTFDVETVASYCAADMDRLLADPGIVRNRRKIAAAIQNAQKTIEIIEQYGSFDAYIWRYVDDKPIQNAWPSVEAVPSESIASKSMSRDLEKGGLALRARWSVMLSCRLSAWSTTTWWIVSGMKRLKKWGGKDPLIENSIDKAVLSKVMLS